MGSLERRQREKEWRRQQIQAAATELILEKGYSATTIEDIANRTELTPGALYRHFKNKDELFASLLIFPLEKFYEEIKKVHGTAELSHAEKVLGLKTAMFESYQSYPVLFRCINTHLEKTMKSLEPEIANQIDYNYRLVTGVMLDIFNDGMADGEFVQRESIIYVDMLWVMFAGLVLWEEAKRERNPKRNFLQKTLDQSVDVFLAGIRNR